MAIQTPGLPGVSGPGFLRPAHMAVGCDPLGASRSGGNCQGTTAPDGSMNPLPQLLGATSSHGLLSAGSVFSAAFVGASELPNWIQVPRQENGCRSRSSAFSPFFPSGMRTAAANNQTALAPGRRGCSGEPLHSRIGLRRPLRSRAGSAPGLGGVGAAAQPGAPGPGRRRQPPAVVDRAPAVSSCGRDADQADRSASAAAKAR